MEPAVTSQQNQYCYTAGVQVAGLFCCKCTPQKLKPPAGERHSNSIFFGLAFGILIIHLANQVFKRRGAN